MKRNYFFIINIITCVLLTACSGGKADKNIGLAGTLVTDSHGIRIAVMPTLDCLPLFVAEKEKLFEEQGIMVKTYMFSSQMDCDTAFVNGTIDGMFTDLVRIEHLRERGAECVLKNTTNASWQLITNRMARINSLDQMENKMIAMTRFSATHLLADSAMHIGNLTDDKTFLIQINDVNLRLLMLKNNEMDALLLPEPQATKARLMNNKVLIDSREMDVRLGVLAFCPPKDSLISEQIDKFLVAYKQACDTIDKYGLSRYSNIISDYCGIERTVVDSISKELKFATEQNPRKVDVERVKNWYKNSTDYAIK